MLEELLYYLFFYRQAHFIKVKKHSSLILPKLKRLDILIFIYFPDYDRKKAQSYYSRLYIAGLS